MDITDKGFLVFGKRRIGWTLGCASSREEVPRQVSLDSMDNFECRRENGERKLILRWTGSPLLGKDFSVECAWLLLDDGRYEGRFSWSGNDSDLDVETVDFPEITFKAESETRFILQYDIGLLARVLLYKPEPARLRTKMQFSAVFDGDDALYFDTRDTDHHVKFFTCANDSGNAMLSEQFLVPLTAENRASYAIPYPFMLKPFKGNWFDAAMIYREWAIRQEWFTKRRSSERMRDLALWIWNRGKAAEVTTAVRRLQDETGLPVALSWYWWHHNPYDMGYPEFWPPREGEESFCRTIAELNSENIYSQVYINGVTWDIDGETYEPEDGDSCITRERGGKVFSHMFNVYTGHRLGYICGEAEIFHRKLRSLVRKITASGIPGVYVDMIGTLSYRVPCYNPRHKHPAGGGNTGHTGYKKLVDDIRAENPGVLLSTESLSEQQDMFESFIVLQPSLERIGNGEDGFINIPVFAAVYHGGFAMFGSYALPDSIPPWDPLWPDTERFQSEKPWHQMFPDQFFIELARCIAWGIQPCVCNILERHLEDPEFRDQIDFIKATIKFYHAHREWLYDGRMLRPGDLESNEIEVKFIRRTIFTTEKTVRYPVLTLPAVLASEWEAPDGPKMVVLANYSSAEQPYSYRSANFSITGTIAPHSYKAEISK